MRDRGYVVKDGEGYYLVSMQLDRLGFECVWDADRSLAQRFANPQATAGVLSLNPGAKCVHLVPRPKNADPGANKVTFTMRVSGFEAQS